MSEHDARRAADYLRATLHTLPANIARDVKTVVDAMNALLPECVPARITSENETSPPCETGLKPAVEAFTKWLAGRSVWLDSEIRGGGNYQDLSTRVSECNYIAANLQRTLKQSFAAKE